MNALLLAIAALGVNVETHIHVIDGDTGQPVQAAQVYLQKSDGTEFRFGSTNEDGVATNVLAAEGYEGPFNTIVRGFPVRIESATHQRDLPARISWDSGGDLTRGFVVLVRDSKKPHPPSSTRYVPTVSRYAPTAQYGTAQYVSGAGQPSASCACFPQPTSTFLPPQPAATANYYRGAPSYASSPALPTVAYRTGGAFVNAYQPVRRPTVVPPRPVYPLAIPSRTLRGWTPGPITTYPRY